MSRIKRPTKNEYSVDMRHCMISYMQLCVDVFTLWEIYPQNTHKHNCLYCRIASTEKNKKGE
jgi:hypothetical protein